MKKLCLMLALVLALACLPAMAAEGDALLGHSDENSVYFNYCFAVGDTLYATSYSSLYTYHVGDPDLTEYVFELPEDETGARDYSVLPFVSDGELYALCLVTRYGETTEFEGAQVMVMTLTDQNTAVFEPQCDVDWSDLVEYYDGDNAYPSRPDCVLGIQGGKAIVRTYDVQGGADNLLFTVDVHNGKRESLDALRDVFAITPYRDGALLVEQYNYSNPTETALVVYDPVNESTQPLAQITVDEYSPLIGLAYDAAGDTVYCVRGGEVCPVDLQSGEILAGVTDMPLENYGTVLSACVLEGGYFIYIGDGLAVRNLDPAQKAEIRLKINDSSWQEAVNNAYYRFSNAHGDISVVLSREYSEVNHLIENMMNRDDSIDVYTLSTSTPVYEALYKRGYLMELDGSEKIVAFANDMYPSLRDALSSDGHLVALPVSAYSYTIGINQKALKALGKSMDDVPDNWPEFLDFIAGLKDVINEDSKVKLFYAGYSAEDARNELFTAIFEDYQRYVNRTDPAMGYNTEMLLGLIKKLEQVDFVAMGYLPQAERDENNDMEDFEYTEESILLQTGTGCSIGNFYSESTPLLLGMAPGMTTPITLESVVAVVNPFTRHPDEALAFMEELLDNIPSATRYCYVPSLSEPIRGKWNQEAITEFQKQLDELKADLEKADASDRQMIEDSIRDTEETLKYYDENGWEVGQRDLDWYRTHDADIAISASNWLYSENGGEAYELIQQYQEGQISAEDMLAGIDRKVQMMLLEGN